MSPAALLLGLAPVLLFLAALLLMDSYKLVHRRAVLGSVLAGTGAAGLALLANAGVITGLGVEPDLVRRLIAPLIEEVLKAAWVVWLLRAERVGFMVDAGIHGFAVGTGFALVENVWYAGALGETALVLWLVRGLGTAVLHGSTTAVVAILGKALSDRRGAVTALSLLPGFALATGAHLFYNQLVLSPLLSTALLLLVMPLLLLVVYERSERSTRTWLGTGLDRDVELLDMVLGEDLPNTPVGRYLDSMRHHVAPQVLGDMLCLLRIHLELSMRAKALLMARQAGIEIPMDEEARANFAELRWLEKSVGPAGRMALVPLRRTSARDLWQLWVLEGK